MFWLSVEQLYADFIACQAQIKSSYKLHQINISLQKLPTINNSMKKIPVISTLLHWIYHMVQPRKYPSKRILFICKKRITSYGYLASSGLLNSAKMVIDALIKEHIACQLVEVLDGNGIDKEVHNYKPTHVVLEAFWCPPYKLQELVKLYPTIDWTVRNHSKIPFLSGEGMAFDWAFAYNTLTVPQQYTLSSNSKEATKDFKYIGIPCEYLPNIYSGTTLNPQKPVHSDTEIHIGCFGAIRLLKNTVIQAIAAIKFAEKRQKTLVFHINVARQEMQGDNPLKNLRALFANNKHKHRLVEHDWLDHDAFMNVVKTMDIGLQVSYTETFNIIAGDFVYAGVPIVVSSEIDWMPTYCQVNPNNVDDMVETLNRLYRMNKEDVQDDCLDHISHYNKKSLDAWLKYIEAS